jgi:mono/diheme cytochrome c family protein
MAEVTGNLAGLPESDINAIAAYVASEMGEPEARREAAKQSDAMTTAAAPRDDEAQGAAIYDAACAMCHEGGRPPPFGGLDFRSSTSVNAPNPQNVINVTLFGLPPADGEASAVMPAFGASLSDQQVADLLAYMRRHFSGKAPWEGVAEMVRKTRSGEYKVAVRPADGIERAPQNVGAKE